MLGLGYLFQGQRIYFLFKFLVNSEITHKQKIELLFSLITIGTPNPI